MKRIVLKRLLFLLAVLLLFAAEILRVYFVMPLPGSQVGDTVTFAHWLNQSIVWIRVLGLLVIFAAFISVFRRGRTWEKIALPLVVATYAVVFFAFNFKLPADRVFHTPVNLAFAAASDSDLDRSKLVIGIVIGGQAKAYPIQLIGYHHQVMDTIGHTPIMVTYCTVCRSGRVFSPIVNGRLESFRLVGMDHFNAVFEDVTTRSWWQQATGKSISGPLKGHVLQEYPSAQMTLESWLRQHPKSQVMRPDTLFMDYYFKLEDYDKGTMRSDLVRRDKDSWQPNSWIVGVKNNYSSKAYDWNDLVQKRVIEDSIDEVPIVLTIESDSASFHVYDRRVNEVLLTFRLSANNQQLVDVNTLSTWNMDGVCVEGTFKGKKLVPMQSYNEFWHSWQTFHKNAKIYVGTYAQLK